MAVVPPPLSTIVRKTLQHKGPGGGDGGGGVDCLVMGILKFSPVLSF